MARHEVALRGREEIAEGTMAFRFAKPAGFAFKPGQSVSIALVDPPAERHRVGDAEPGHHQHRASVRARHAARVANIGPRTAAAPMLHAPVVTSAKPARNEAHLCSSQATARAG